MDARLSPEQRDLRVAAAALADDLGPHSVLDLSDSERTLALAKALASTGWRALRSDGASGVEIALVTEEFARGLVDVPFVGPVLADAVLADAVRVSGEPATIVMDGAAPDAFGITRGLALDGTSVLTGPLGEAVTAVDLTRGVAPAAGEFVPAGEISAEDAARWQALAIVVTCADLLGAARGAHALAVGYAKVRAQYGQAIGANQGVSHPLASGSALIEGMTSILRYAAWAVDETSPAEALRLARVAKVYAARSALTVCETAIQVHGGIGNTWDCLAHVFLRRVLVATELFPVRLETVVAKEVNRGLS